MLLYISAETGFETEYVGEIDQANFINILLAKQ